MTTRIDSRSLRETTTPEGAVLTAAPALDSSRRLPIASIRLDGGTQPRAELNQEYIADLADDLRAGAILPSIDVMYDGDNYWLFDGYHRLHAHKAVYGANASIDVRVHQGSQQDAQWLSYAVNKAHGLRRTTEDKQRAIIAALKHPNGASRSNRELARHLGVDHKTVGYWREKLESAGEIPQLTKRIGFDGKTYDTTNIGANQRRETYASGLPKLDLPLRMAGAPLDLDRQEDATGDSVKATTEIPQSVESSVVASDATHTRQKSAPLGKCYVCNRPLYDPIRASQGIGACCAAKQAAGPIADSDHLLPDWATSDNNTAPTMPVDDKRAWLKEYESRFERCLMDIAEWANLTGRHILAGDADRGLRKLLDATRSELAALNGHAHDAQVEKETEE